jgi:hypothetical protein
MFTIRKNFAGVKAPRNVIKQGYWVLRTTDVHKPSGPVVDPTTGTCYPSLDAAIPAGWEEAFRDEYIPGAQRIRGRRARVEIFPHEVVLVDPTRRTVELSCGRLPDRSAVSAGTCIPAWITKA